VSGNDSTSKTLVVALALCIVCSVIVSAAVVILKPIQEVNKTLDRKRNILAAAGMLAAAASEEDINAQFADINTRVVDLNTGKFADGAVDVARYDQRKAAKDPDLSEALTTKEDLAKISRREQYAVVYLVQNPRGAIEKVILPIRGYGLWSTLYGFIALESDNNTIAGLGFYEHGETPGLGGEVDNPRWKALWSGKQVYRDGEVEIELVKGAVNPASVSAPWEVDGLAGATLTSKGVTNLVHFWLGENGFEPFLLNLQAGDA
jgi:Na+-transporting NADH:ubiquinone oxidoreductase subunit C